MSLPGWMDGLTHKDWLMDGSPIRGERMLAMWHDLDWSQAWVDMGPSIAGNPGPYWHVPLKTLDDTTHRLYPKLLRTKWLPVVRAAIQDVLERNSDETLRRENAELFMENIELKLKLRDAERDTAHEPHTSPTADDAAR